MTGLSQTPIGQGSYWAETVEELAARWLRTAPPAAAGDPDLTAEVISTRTRRRAASVARYLQIKPPPVLRNPRQWQTTWDSRARWKELSDALARIGWTTGVSERRTQTNLLVAHPGASADTVIVETPAAMALADSLHARGLAIPFAWEDAAVLLLAGETYRVAVAHMGHQPREPWVDRIAVQVFSQTVLGLPFCPWLVELIPQPK